MVETTEIVALEAPSEGHDEHGHEEAAGGDPHVWLDPARLSKIAAGFTEEMAAADPSHAKDYRANLADLEKDLAALDEAYTAGLAQCAVDTVVVSHDAFGYLEKYGLHFESIAGLSPDAEPSPAHIRELHDLIETEQITTVFSETLASPKMSKTIADDLGLSTGVLDPIEGLSDRTADEDYLSLMRDNLAALQKANGCR
jgi:zinc transport system substrate-binding protein